MLWNDQLSYIMNCTWLAGRCQTPASIIAQPFGYTYHDKKIARQEKLHDTLLIYMYMCISTTCVNFTNQKASFPKQVFVELEGQQFWIPKQTLKSEQSIRSTNPNKQQEQVNRRNTSLRVSKWKLSETRGNSSFF